MFTIFKIKDDFQDSAVKKKTLNGIKAFFEENKERFRQVEQEAFEKFSKALNLDQIFMNLEE